MSLLLFLYCSVCVSSTFSLLNLYGESIITCKKDGLIIFSFKTVVRPTVIINFSPTGECEFKSERQDDFGCIVLKKFSNFCSITAIEADGHKTVTALNNVDEISILFKINFNIKQIMREFGSDIDIIISEECNIISVSISKEESNVVALKFYKSKGWSIEYKPMLKSMYSFSCGDEVHSYTYFFLKEIRNAMEN